MSTFKFSSEFAEQLAGVRVFMREHPAAGAALVELDGYIAAGSSGASWATMFIKYVEAARQVSKLTIASEAVLKNEHLKKVVETVKKDAKLGVASSDSSTAGPDRELGQLVEVKAEADDAAGGEAALAPLTAPRVGPEHLIVSASELHVLKDSYSVSQVGHKVLDMSADAIALGMTAGDFNSIFFKRLQADLSAFAASALRREASKDVMADLMQPARDGSFAPIGRKLGEDMKLHFVGQVAIGAVPVGSWECMKAFGLQFYIVPGAK
eukprot:7189671-Pyramimonas_sp.AAC.1